MPHDSTITQAYSGVSKDLRDIEVESKLHPELWRKCYPRIYREPTKGTYWSPKLASIQIFHAARELIAVEQNDPYIQRLLEAEALLKFKVPTFFLAPELTRAITNTATPTDIPWLKMKLPYEAGVFMLPKGTLYSAAEGEVCYIAYARIEGVEQYSTITGKTFLPRAGFLLAAQTENGRTHHWGMNGFQLGERLSLPDIEEYAKNLPTLRPESRATYMSEEENSQLMVRVAHYVFSTLLIMTERPSLLTPASLSKRVHRRNELPKEFWSPNVIGANYVVQQESHKPVGSHQSPRLHFVRGFWRQQSYGVGRSLRRPMWIEPFLRGGKF